METHCQVEEDDGVAESDVDLGTGLEDKGVAVKVKGSIDGSNGMSCSAVVLALKELVRRGVLGDMAHDNKGLFEGFHGLARTSCCHVRDTILVKVSNLLKEIQTQTHDEID